MKKLIISIFALCSCFTSQGYSETYLSDFFDVIHDESLQKEAFSIDKKIQDKYQAVAKQFSKKGSTQTNIVTYETTNTGVNVHVGWYADGFVGTALDGPEAGKQVILFNGSVVGISYDIKVYNDHFTHNYTWTKIISYANKQIFKFK